MSRKPKLPYSAHITVPIQGEEAPKWLSHIEFYRVRDEIVIEIIKENGLSYGHGKMSDVAFNNMADLILTIPQQEEEE